MDAEEKEINTDAHVIRSRERKRRLAGLMYRGVSLDQVADKLAEQYNVMVDTVKQDWYRREDWMDEIFEIDPNNAHVIIKDIMAEEKIIKQEFWKQYQDSNNPSVGMNCLREVRNSNTNLVDLLKDIGAIDKDAGIVNNIVIENKNEQVSVDEEDKTIADEIEEYREFLGVAGNGKDKQQG